MKIFDKSTISSRTKTKDGFLLVTARVGRPGTQVYIKDVDPGFTNDNLPEYLQSRPTGSQIIMLRPAAEVFDAASMASFENVPVTNNHPSQGFVNSGNVKKFQVGFSKMVTKSKDGSALEASLIIQDEQTIRMIEDGKEEISLGYGMQPSWVQGTDAEYGVYDGIFKNIDGNHIAIVDKARAGSDFRLNDQKPKVMNMEKQIRIVDGKQIELSADAAAIFDGMVSTVKSQTAKIDELTVAVADSAKEVETLSGKLEATKAIAISDEDMAAKVDAAVAGRLFVIDAAAKVLDSAAIEGKTESELKLAVIAKLGNDKIDVADASADKIDVIFDTLVATATPKTDKITDAMGKPVVDAMPDSNMARAKMMEKRNKR